MNSQQDFKKALKSCHTMNDIFSAVNEFYDMDEKLGLATKAVITSQIGRLIDIVGAKERKPKTDLKPKSWL